MSIVLSKGVKLRLRLIRAELKKVGAKREFHGWYLTDAKIAKTDCKRLAFYCKMWISYFENKLIRQILRELNMILTKLADGY